MSANRVTPRLWLGSRVHGASTVVTTSIVAGLVVLGCLARAWHYFLNYSLNHDDAALAVNIIQRSIWQFNAPLDYGQLAPWAFLIVERAVTHLFGSTELALRLIPFVASLVSVPLFWHLATQRLRQPEAVFATGFFSVSQALVGATAQVKQYSADVVLAIVLLLACGPLLEHSLSRRQRLQTAVCGSLAIWVSFPAVFVLAGIGLASIVGRRATEDLRERLTIGGLWVASGLVYLSAVVRSQLQGSPMFTIWEQQFLPKDPVAWPQWFIQAFENLGSISTSVRLAPLAAGAVVFALWLTLRSQRRFGLALAFTILATLFAACLRRYPFFGRFLFFAAPVLLLLVCDETGRWVRQRAVAIRRIVTVAASTALLYAVASLIHNTFLKDPTFDDPRGVLIHVQLYSRPGDLIYASEAAWPSLRYYQARIGIDPRAVIRDNSLNSSGRPPSGAMPLEAARVWFVFFWPTEAGIDQQAVSKSGRSGVVLHSVTRKRHRAVLWCLDCGAPDLRRRPELEPSTMDRHERDSFGGTRH